MVAQDQRYLPPGSSRTSSSLCSRSPRGGGSPRPGARSRHRYQPPAQQPCRPGLVNRRHRPGAAQRGSCGRVAAGEVVVHGARAQPRPAPSTGGATGRPGPAAHRGRSQCFGRGWVACSAPGGPWRPAHPGPGPRHAWSRSPVCWCSGWSCLPCTARRRRPPTPPPARCSGKYSPTRASRGSPTRRGRWPGGCRPCYAATPDQAGGGGNRPGTRPFSPGMGWSSRKGSTLFS